MGGYRNPQVAKAYKERYRQEKPDQYRAERQRYKRTLVGKRMLRHEFVGVDGEGWTDETGTHHYMTLTVGDRTLYTGQPLSGLDCLNYLADIKPSTNVFLVSFFFDYDVTMILRDLAQEDPELAAMLFVPQRPGTMVWWRGFGIAYRPKKHLKIKRWTLNKDDSHTVTIHDVQGFYQSAFITALDNFNVGAPEVRDEIREMKAKRDSFTSEDAPRIIAYSESECSLLVELVGKLRDATHLAGVNASPYEGPGDMARRALEQNYTKERHQLAIGAVPHAVMAMAEKSYYGGRFEITAHGPIIGEVHESDLKSAYPAAMTELPCLVHGRWVRGLHPDATLTLSHVEWHITNAGFKTAMPLPVRRKDGTIYYPSQGEGWYWRHEYSVIPEGQLNVGVSWSFIPGCDCQPFAWVNDIFNRRLELEAEKKGSGIALKLMLNTLYGKMCQQRPVKGSFFNMVYASLITSLTRTKVYRVYLDNPGRVIMFATDAVFTIGKPEGLTVGTGLGEWEEAHVFNDMTIFQPGVYFDGDQAAFKTRGIPKKIFREHAPALKAIALDFDAKIPVTLESHLSLRLALSRGTEKAISQIGNWVENEKKMTSNPKNKRETRLWRDKEGNHWSRPIREYGKTVPYNSELSDAMEGVFRVADDFISDGFYEGTF